MTLRASVARARADAIRSAARTYNRFDHDGGRHGDQARRQDRARHRRIGELGQRFATVLARAGRALALAARRTDRLAALAHDIESSGGVAHPVAMDVTDVASVRAGVAAAEGALGPIDILVQQLRRQRDQAHRGGRGRVRPSDGHQRQGYVLRGAGGGRGHDRRPAPGTDRQHHFGCGPAVARAAVGLLHVEGGGRPPHALARPQWERHGINANALCPGYIATKIAATTGTATADASSSPCCAPDGQVGKPEDLDALVLLLASDASGFVNGAVIAADDGLSVT